jgi:uncharacterized membrane protein YhhN
MGRFYFVGDDGLFMFTFFLVRFMDYTIRLAWNKHLIQRDVTAAVTIRNNISNVQNSTNVS